MPSQSRSISLVVEADDRGHRPGRRRRRGRRGEPPLAREIRRRAIVDRARRGQGAAYSPTECPTTKSGCSPASVKSGQAGELGRHERRLGDVGLAQALERAGEAQPRRYRSPPPRLRGRRRLARPGRPRSSHAPYPPPGTPAPGSRTPPCPPSHALLAATADQTTPEAGARAPAVVQASVNPNDSWASSTRSPLQCTLPVPRPKVLRRRSTVSS